MRLLVTRPESETGALAEELRNLGHEPVLQPLLQYHGLEFDPAPIETAQALILTSGNGLRALRERIDLSGFSNTPVFCVGNETARRAREAGLQAVAATAQTAEELAAKIVQTVKKNERLVHVTGEHQAFDLAEALVREGLSICTLRVYDMKARSEFESPVVDEIKAGRIGGVILMSPRTAEVFVSLCRKHLLLDCANALRYFCLAGSVARKLKPLEPAQVYVAVEPNRPALLALVAALPTPGHDRVKQDR